MKFAFIAVFLCLPFTVVCMKHTYGEYPITLPSFVHQQFYMLAPEDVPEHAQGGPNPGKSFINADFSIKKADESKPATTLIQYGIIPEEDYNYIGFEKEGKKLYCCDSEAASKGLCQEPGKIAFQKGIDMSKIPIQQREFKGQPITLAANMNVAKKGKYVMVIGLCQVETTNLVFTYRSEVVNPYGHIQPNVYGFVGFTYYLLAAYTTLFLLWVMRCCLYKRELMSVHYTITVVIALFVFDVLVRYLNLRQTNETGVKDSYMTFFSLFVSSATRAISRILILMIANGLGVSKASLGSGIFKIIAVGIVYFVFSFWDSIMSTFHDPPTNVVRIIISSVLDTFIYYYILQSLIDTIQDLSDKRQTSKLNVFTNLLKIIFIAVIVSTVYNVFFSITMKDILRAYWQYQWFFSEGVWSLFYCFLVVSIVWLWRPNENSGSLAMRFELEQEERQDAEEYTMDSLQPADGSQSVEVTTVKEQLKPMQIKAASS